MYTCTFAWQGWAENFLPFLTAQTALVVLYRDMLRSLDMARTALLERAGAL